MRGLIIFCVVSLSAAAPQGYTYPLGHEVVRAEQGVQQDQQYSVDSPLVEDSLRALHFPSDHLRRPFATYGVLPEHKQNVVMISKRFFIHSAADEEDDEVAEKVVTLGPHKKNYNVVFIRAPTKVQKPATVKIVPAIKEEKTVVYVLSKKDDPVEVHARVEELPTTTTKPEVYFIKYKTPEEANHAQGQIQAEYEHLGGSTQILNEGVSSVSSVIGSLHEKDAQPDGAYPGPSSAPVLANAVADDISGVALNSNSYLPPNYNH